MLAMRQKGGDLSNRRGIIVHYPISRVESLFTIPPSNLTFLLGLWVWQWLRKSYGASD